MPDHGLDVFPGKVEPDFLLCAGFLTIKFDLIVHRAMREVVATIGWCVRDILRFDF